MDGAPPIPIGPVSASGSVQFCLHGPPAVGKTSLIGSGSPQFKQLMIRPPTDHANAILGSGVQEWVTKTWSEMEEVEEYLEHEGNQWDWVWWDSASGWQNHGLDDIWQMVLDRRPDRKGGPIDKGEYGRNMTRILQWVRHVAGISEAGNFNFGITAWSEDIWEEQFEEEIAKPWIQGKMMSDSIMGYMNLVGYMELYRDRNGNVVKSKKTGRPRRVIHFDLTEEYYGKDQFNAFDKDRLVDPTLPKIMEHIEAAKAKAAPTSKKPAARRRRRKSK